MIALCHQPALHTLSIDSFMDPHPPTPQNAPEPISGPLTHLLATDWLSSPPPDHLFETPHVQSTTTMERIRGTQEPKDIHPTGISFQVSNKSPYGSLERPTLPKEGEFMSLLRVTIETLQELKQRRPQFPIFPEHAQSTLTSELRKRMMGIIPLPKYPPNGLPIHSAVLGMFT